MIIIGPLNKLSPPAIVMLFLWSIHLCIADKCPDVLAKVETTCFKTRQAKSDPKRGGKVKSMRRLRGLECRYGSGSRFIISTSCLHLRLGHLSTDPSVFANNDPKRKVWEVRLLCRRSGVTARALGPSFPPQLPVRGRRYPRGAV